MDKKEIDRKAVNLRETFNKKMERIKKYPAEEVVKHKKPKEYAWKSAS